MTVTIDDFLNDNYDADTLDAEALRDLEVEASLYRAAIGGWVTSGGPQEYSVDWSSWPYERKPINAPTREYIRPDLRAIEIWLAHRRPERWPLLARKMKS
jgi:hypothetical protein